MHHYKGLHCKNQTRLYRSLLKYGFKAHIFSVLEQCEDSEMNLRERYWQEFYDCIGSQGLNCKLTGFNDNSGELSQETKDKISKSNKGKCKPPISDLGRKNISKSLKGKKKTKEHANNISKSKIGVLNPMYGRKALNRRCVELVKDGVSIMFFESLKEAEEATGADFRNIQAVCKGRRKTTLGMVFKYSDK